MLPHLSDSAFMIVAIAAMCIVSYLFSGQHR